MKHYPNIITVKGVGTTGYKVNFSVIDLYKLGTIAQFVIRTCREGSDEERLAQAIIDLCDATINGGLEKDKFSFLESKEEFEDIDY